MKKTNIIYWGLTGLLAAFMLMSGIQGLLHSQQAIDLVHGHLGYPEYFITFSSIAKVLGAIGIVVPGFPRIKEWIYAGFTYDLVAALYSIIAVGDPASKWAFMFVFLAIVAGSYIYYHKKLRAGIS